MHKLYNPLSYGITDEELKVRSYFHREIFTVCFLLAVLWPLTYGIQFVSKNKLLCATWAIGCGLMSVFTLLPAVKVEDITTMYANNISDFDGPNANYVTFNV